MKPSDLSPCHVFDERIITRGWYNSLRFVSGVSADDAEYKNQVEAGVSTMDHPGFCGGVVFVRGFLRAWTHQPWRSAMFQVKRRARYKAAKWDPWADAAKLWPKQKMTGYDLLSKTVMAVMYRAMVNARTRYKGQIIMTDVEDGALDFMYQMCKASAAFNNMFPFELEYHDGEDFENPNTRHLCVTRRIVMGEETGTLLETHTSTEAKRAADAMERCRVNIVMARYSVLPYFHSTNGDNA